MIRPKEAFTQCIEKKDDKESKNDVEDDLNNQALTTIVDHTNNIEKEDSVQEQVKRVVFLLLMF